LAYSDLTLYYLCFIFFVSDLIVLVIADAEMSLSLFTKFKILITCKITAFLTHSENPVHNIGVKQAYIFDISSYKKYLTDGQ